MVFQPIYIWLKYLFPSVHIVAMRMRAPESIIPPPIVSESVMFPFFCPLQFAVWYVIKNNRCEQWLAGNINLGFPSCPVQLDHVELLWGNVHSGLMPGNKV